MPKGAIWEAWDPDNVINEVRDATVANMERACEFLTGEIKDAAPERTGRLRESIDYEITITDGVVEGHVGVRHGYYRTHIARFLEFGTRKMVARPFLRPPLLQNKGRILKILQGG
jgi:HK97 gp10 family phage protein